MTDEQDPITLTPIGIVRGARVEPTDDHWGGAVSRIDMLPDVVTASSPVGLDAFSHIEVIFFFHLVTAGSEEMAARRPRDNPAWPEVGIYAQRARRRLNRLGISRCRLLEADGLTLVVEGLDAIDGTPVIDVKPWLAELAPRGEVMQPAWSTEVMERYYAPAAEEQ